MSPKIKYLDFNLNRRILFASDIHGNYKLFDALLKKVNFNNLDYLFIIGDMIEKSDYNLDTLDYFMALDKKENVFIPLILSLISSDKRKCYNACFLWKLVIDKNYLVP